MTTRRLRRSLSESEGIELGFCCFTTSKFRKNGLIPIVKSTTKCNDKTRLDTIREEELAKEVRDKTK